MIRFLPVALAVFVAMRSMFSMTCAVLAVAAIVACAGIAAAQPTAPVGTFRWNSSLNSNVPTEILPFNATHLLVLANGAFFVSRAHGVATPLAPAFVTAPTAAVVLPLSDVVVFCGVGGNFEGAYVSAVNVSNGALVWSVNGSSSNGCSQILYSAKSAAIVVLVGNNVPVLFNASTGAQRQLPAFAASSTNIALSTKGSTLFVVTGGGNILSAFDVATGKSMWNASIEFNNGILFVSATDSGVAGGVIMVAGFIAYSAVNGTQLWTASSGYGGSIAFSAGTAFAIQNGNAYAFDGASGKLLWSRTGGSYAFLAAYRGLAYFTSGNSQDTFVAAVGARTGDQRWAVTGVTGGMAATANDALYVFANQYGGSPDDGILALSAKHGALLDFWATPSGTPTIFYVSQSSMYIGGGNTLLTALTLLK